MSESNKDGVFRHNTVYERDPCDCTCALFPNYEQDSVNDDGVRQMTRKTRHSRQNKSSGSLQKLKNKISVSSVTRRKHKQEAEVEKSHEPSYNPNKETRVLLELLEKPVVDQTSRVQTSFPMPIHKIKLNHTVQLHRPMTYIPMQQILQGPIYDEQTKRKNINYADPTICSTNYLQKTCDQTIKSVSRPELLNQSMGGIQMLTPMTQSSSYCHDGRTMTTKSMARSTDQFYQHKIPNMMKNMRIGYEVPETVPEEQTSRSNTVDIFIPPIPIKQIDEKKKGEMPPRPPNRNKSINQGSHHNRTQRTQRKSITEQISVEGGIARRETDTVTSHAQQPIRMGFKKIESVGDDDYEKEDSISEVLGHYQPVFELPIKKLLNRQQDKEDKPAECHSSRSRYEMKGQHGAPYASAHSSTIHHHYELSSRTERHGVVHRNP